MRTQEVLDSIDHALGDWSVSPDAMRWMPEKPAATGIDFPRITYTQPDLATLGRAIAEFGRSISESMNAFAAAVNAAEPQFRRLHELLDKPSLPEDPKARALALRQKRNTGPSRDLTKQHRPRRHTL